MLSVFIGSLDGPGNVDGSGPVVRFNAPGNLAADRTGNIYVADSASHTIRKITPSGVVSTIAGRAGWPGWADGRGITARFNRPTGIAVDRQGNIFVADSENRLVRKINADGVVSSFAGTVDNKGKDGDIDLAAHFGVLRGLTIDSAGNIFVSDDGNVIRRITPTGSVSILAGKPYQTGYVDGPGTSARFDGVFGMATDSADNLYVADAFNRVIRKITPAGLVSTFAGKAGTDDSIDGVGSAARFHCPIDVTTDHDGNLYVADGFPLFEDQESRIRRVTSHGNVTTILAAASGKESGGDAGESAKYMNISGITVDGSGNIYIAEYKRSTVSKIALTSGATTRYGSIEGEQSVGYYDGVGSEARFDEPDGVAVDNVGNVYVANGGVSSAIRIITQDGVVSTLGASVTREGVVFRVDQNHDFTELHGVARDDAGNIYVADSLIKNLSRDVGMGPGVLFRFLERKKFNYIRKISPSGMVSTLAGRSARLSFPRGVAIDKSGNIYVADTDNHTIRKIAPRLFIGSRISTLAGTEDVSGSADGIGATALFRFPEGVATDGAGNIYVADTGNNTIRKITTDGTVTTLAGTAGQSGSADGIGSAASFAGPRSLAVDSTENLYVVDGGNHTIRKITPAGVVSTLVGKVGQIGFEAGALPGVLAAPMGIAIHGSSLYITMRNGVAIVRNLP